ncbi:MAG: hypothetical protein R6V28_11920, partial [Nitriliruptoraceae bacterium]
DVTDDSGTDVDNDDPTVTVIEHSPAIAFVKEGSYDEVAGTITYTFTVNNTGNVTVSNIVIDDELIDVTGLPISPSTLAPGQSGTATAVYNVTQADVDAGGVINQALATGQGPEGGDVTDDSGTDVDNDDQTFTELTSNPAIAMVKSETFNAEAGTVTYTFKVTNTGNATVRNIAIDDERIGVSELAIAPQLHPLLPRFQGGDDLLGGVFR